MNLSVRKNYFEAGPKSCTDDHFFVLYSLTERMYTKVKFKERIFSQKRSVANVFHEKLQTFAFYESWLSYKKEKRSKTVPSVKSSFEFEVGLKLIRQQLCVCLPPQT